MDNYPFRRLVLPALLASSAGFAAFTWPIDSDRAAQVAERLLQPLNRWVDPTLTTAHHKEFSIRYGGFAILSSVAIGIGTAGAMRTRQGRGQPPQGLRDGGQMALGGDRPAADPLDTLDSIDLAVVSDQTASADTALDWVSLLHTIPENHTESNLLSTAIDEHALYHIQGVDQRRCLALAVEGEYYRYYRNRPDLDKAWALVQQLQQQGKSAIATWDGNGYVVWVHQPERPQQIIPWPQATG
ncbi:hypothetical protein VB780_21015 [Leptolyngbya sp. CCNP1308]|uniref:hypothetical protein n=1 Tax=Leptolyngbya sp. CCNP1308 TaxID=3110255 RepID=UPI002B1FA79C|nr:hypothetical protein [Leptolyngbya sp. CCNP1308]MEA5451073.1 hypothetical protein [Leptolyngbya sp. CCNP1308]